MEINQVSHSSRLVQGKADQELTWRHCPSWETSSPQKRQESPATSREEMADYGAIR